MPVTHNLTVQHHQQDTDYYCGAACAQMVLETIGAGLESQDTLYADNHSHSVVDSGVNWATGPDGLQWTMLNRRPASFTNWFALYADPTEDALSRKLGWTIHHYQVAPIALVYGWAHWIVVKGYQSSAHPTGSGDTGYTFDGFYINNPWPPVPSGLASPPPHTGSDGCGTGGTRGIANEYVTYATWQSTYMTGVPGGYWTGKHVAVCDPEPPAREIGKQAIEKPWADGETIIDPQTAAKFALQGLEQHNLTREKGWENALAGIEPVQPLLVARLDRPNRYYYLVRMRRRELVSALALVDGRFGNFQQAATLERDDLYRNVIGRDDIEKILFEKPIWLGKLQGRLKIYPKLYCIYPTLVWRPCQESLSPYYPFYMVSVGEHRIYIRIDGAVFTSLTTDTKGI